MFVAIGLLFLSHLMAVSLAACCDAQYLSSNGQWICGDGTVATPCCGKGPCDAFCCNCDCRSPSSRKRDLPFLMERAEQVDSLFQSVDADGSGDLDLGEYIAWVTEHLGREHPVSPSLYQAYIDHFYSFDMDKNSKLDLGEVRATK
ncbi:uncharacterized protein APUU_30846S [Aspergillus puulaauensis]|uniref:EF-hand domain-containing protein n=1 Tax=Aspergillus puulaauensis TaxID=1220207 RepID=A0A7R7XJF9_9EURO|nr:uncharacterized protein APUU_30846S [Aspergillus puulaauensis]BCS22621.1 hypothetical protein APUU_30846S [Aspergillus puulaauensis]